MSSGENNGDAKKAFNCFKQSKVLPLSFIKKYKYSEKLKNIT